MRSSLCSILAVVILLHQASGSVVRHSNYRLQTDGGWREGRAGAGLVLSLDTYTEETGELTSSLLCRGSVWLGGRFSIGGALEAEYHALIEGLLLYRRMIRRGILSESIPLRCLVDSKVVVTSLAGSSCEHQSVPLLRLRSYAASLLRAATHGYTTLEHTMREDNVEADALATRSLFSGATEVECAESEDRSQWCHELVCWRLTPVLAADDPLAAAYHSLHLAIEVQGCVFDVDLGPLCRLGEDPCLQVAELLTMQGRDPPPDIVQATLIDALRPDWRYSAPLPQGRDTDLWRTLPLPTSLDTSVGALPAVKLSYTYLRINELHLSTIHSSTLLRDASLVGELLRAAARLGRLRWLLTSRHEGLTLFERALLLDSRQITMVFLDVAGMACLHTHPSDMISSLAPKMSKLQAKVLQEWYSKNKLFGISD
jgi:hypothetical protein